MALTDTTPLIAFALRERRAQQAEAATTELLSSDALAALGYAIAGLLVVECTKDHITLRCQENYSRFRAGDKLTLTHEDSRFRGTLLAVTDNGRTLTLRAGKLPHPLAEGPWFATEDASDLSGVVISTLEKLQPGAPGWGFFRVLMGQRTLEAVQASGAATDLHARLAQEAGRSLDDSQLAVFAQCLSAPPALGVQGPPGTGKTTVLAFVVEGLMRQGKRVAVVAPTHQAVNNALSTLHALFPQRPVVKVGDDLHRESLADDIRVVPYADKGAFKDSDIVVGMTYMAALHRLMLASTIAAPNVLIVEEAGQLPLTQGAVAGLCGAGSVLLFGDDMQMPPVFSGDVADDPLATSVFAWLRSQQPAGMSMLRTSYRLNQQLCDAIGGAFYAEGGASLLAPSRDAAVQRLSPDIALAATSQVVQDALAPEPSLVWLHVPGRASTQVNAAEAQLTAEILAACLHGGLRSDQIAAVTPFRRQAARIRAILGGLVGAAALPIVDTVERVQGLTVEVVVVSMCASEPGYVQSLAGFLFSPNRLNVAVSRARCKAIVLSAPNVFDVLPTEYVAFVARNRCRALLAAARR